MDENTKRTIVIVTILGLVLISYVIFVFLSFCFMHSFKKKINTAVDTINVILYQKIMGIYECVNELIKLGYDNPKLLDFKKNSEFKEYKPVGAKDFNNLFTKTEEIYSMIKKVCVNLKSNENISEVVSDLDTIKNLNSKYFETVQLYNTYVIGFNYWRNLFFTKWVKILLHKDEIDAIK